MQKFGKPPLKEYQINLKLFLHKLDIKLSKSQLELVENINLKCKYLYKLTFLFRVYWFLSSLISNTTQLVDNLSMLKYSYDFKTLHEESYNKEELPLKRSNSIWTLLIP